MSEQQYWCPRCETGWWGFQRCWSCGQYGVPGGLPSSHNKTEQGVPSPWTFSPAAAEALLEGAL